MPASNKHITDSESLLRAVDCLLGAVNADKHWGDQFYQDWNPVITALTCELLLSCGLAPDTPWHVKRLKHARHTLEGSFHWLDGRIGPDGAFGTDFWDAARFAIFVERDQVRKFFPSYDRLKAYLLSSIQKNTFLAGDPLWSGPGFLAAAADYLDLLGMSGEADAIILRMVACQQDDGSWQGNFGPDGHPLISPVWHTAQVIWTLSRRGLAEHRARINKAIEWLKSVQTQDGYWGGQQQFIIYFTSYALTALLCAEKPETNAISRATEYLKSKMTPDGKCSDMGGTLLCAFALRRLVGQGFQHNLTVADYVLSRNNAIRAEAAETERATKEAELTESRQKLQEVEADYRRLAEKYADGEIVLSKRVAFLYAIIVPLVLVTITATIQFLITKVATLAPSATSPPPKQVTKTNVVIITNIVAPAAQLRTNKHP